MITYEVKGRSPGTQHWRVYGRSKDLIMAAGIAKDAFETTDYDVVVINEVRTNCVKTLTIAEEG